MEEAFSKSEKEKLLSSLLDLRECTKKILEVLLDETPPVANAEQSALQCHDYEPFQPELCRVFLVVMDYDPQSLCITGMPDLELEVQSGEQSANLLDAPDENYSM